MKTLLIIALMGTAVWGYSQYQRAEDLQAQLSKRIVDDNGALIDAQDKSSTYEMAYKDVVREYVQCYPGETRGCRDLR